MRKTWVLVPAIVLCLALAGEPVIGQDESPAAMRPSAVVGELDCKYWPNCEAQLTDPRVSGMFVMSDAGEHVVPGGDIVWGRAKLVGPDGTWRGPYVGTRLGGTTMDYVFTVEGSEGYEGWAFVGTTSEPLGTEGPWQITGAIYEGSARLMAWP